MTQAKAATWPRRIARGLRTIALFVAVAGGIGWTLNRTEQALDHDPAPAGLGRGLLHGALMPLALPNLLIGRDVPIYAVHNTGVSYKLGYTAGVNACGALFFGFFYWRLHRLRKRTAGDPPNQ
jgi:hypothetical protein